MAIYVAAIVFVIEHNWTIFLKFLGGKGVATAFGVTVTVIPIWRSSPSHPPCSDGYHAEQRAGDGGWYPTGRDSPQ